MPSPTAIASAEAIIGIIILLLLHFHRQKASTANPSIKPSTGSLRTCPHRVNVRIIRHNFVGDKAKMLLSRTGKAVYHDFLFSLSLILISLKTGGQHITDRLVITCFLLLLPLARHSR